MASFKLLLPRTLVDFDETTDAVFFLAGPIKGAEDWQKEAISMLAEAASSLTGYEVLYVVCPSEYSPAHELYALKVKGSLEKDYTEEQKKITVSRTDWERHHLEIASRLGGIIFWLGKEDRENPRKREDGPYARDTYGELGEWRARVFYEQKYNNARINLVIGADQDFPGLVQIDRNFKRMVSDSFQISPTLRETIERAISVKIRGNS